LEITQFLSILVVFGLLGATLWWLKKKGAVRMASMPSWKLPSGRARNSERLIERMDALQLSATHSLTVVRVGERALLVGVSPSGLQVVDNLELKSLQSQGVSQ
jgi:flagellar biogenesis protein FliO